MPVKVLFPILKVAEVVGVVLLMLNILQVNSQKDV